MNDLGDHLEAGELESEIQEITRSTGLGRILKILAGIALILAGIAMLFIPGQGVLTIVFGLDLIAPNNPLSRRLRRWFPGLNEDEPIPIVWVVVGCLLTLASIVVAVVWGGDIWNWARELTGL